MLIDPTLMYKLYEEKFTKRHKMNTFFLEILIFNIICTHINKIIEIPILTVKLP